MRDDQLAYLVSLDNSNEVRAGCRGWSVSAYVLSTQGSAPEDREPAWRRSTCTCSMAGAVHADEERFGRIPITPYDPAAVWTTDADTTDA